MAQPADHNTLCCSTESISCAPLLRMKSEANTYSVLPQLASEQITFQKRNIHRVKYTQISGGHVRVEREPLHSLARRSRCIPHVECWFSAWHLRRDLTNTQVTGDVSGWTAMTQALGMCVSRGAFLTWSAGSPPIVCAESWTLPRSLLEIDYLPLQRQDASPEAGSSALSAAQSSRQVKPPQSCPTVG
jgi:hypothetical protein